MLTGRRPARRPERPAPALATRSGRRPHLTQPTRHRPSRPAGTASLTASRIPGCAWCTTAFGADLTVESEQALADVNLWLDGWSGTKRCLYAQHDSPADGFALAARQPARVGFHQASVECAPPFAVDRVDVRVRSGDTLVFQGSWPVRLAFEE